MTQLDPSADLRLINEVPFAQDIPDLEDRAREESLIRLIFASAGCTTAQDIIELGCTGLVMKLRPSFLQRACFVREHMAGAGFGLPCYVPPTRFCLVHNTIGGLQRGQHANHPEGVDLCSRTLTADERKRAAAVNALIDQEGTREAQAKFGAEVVAPEAESTPIPISVPALKSSLESNFCCPEHDGGNPLWLCRYCIAAAIVRGPFRPELMVDVLDNQGVTHSYDIEQLPALLTGDLGTTPQKATVEAVTVFARVRQWTRKLVVNEE